MADAVATNVIFFGPNSRKYVVQLTCRSDGTGETDVVKVDLSTLLLENGLPATSVCLMEAEWDVQGFSSVELIWDDATPAVMKELSGRGYVNYGPYSYLKDPDPGSGSGDILLTSYGAAADATYDITLVLKLHN